MYETEATPEPTLLSGPCGSVVGIRGTGGRWWLARCSPGANTALNVCGRHVTRHGLLMNHVKISSVASSLTGWLGLTVLEA